MENKAKLHRKNLLKLAAGLLSLPKNTEKFDMVTYFVSPKLGDTSLPTKVVECGTAACAVGWAPTFGIKPKKNEDWEEYSYRTLIGASLFISADEWDWCFHSHWSHTDNTPQGAAKRIIWLLLHGLPDNHRDQRMGYDALCYTKMKLPKP